MDILKNLNNENKETRLANLRELKDMIDAGKIEKPVMGNDVNNHIHSVYSFSPYTPSAAVWMAYNSGLCTAGIMDHDSICGAKEFIEAAGIIGMASTIGAEIRADMSKTALAGRRINNPDQKGVAYVAIHGIPHTQIDRVSEFFKPLNKARIERDRKMVAKINEVMAPYGISLDFDADVLPISYEAKGGSVTERHLLFALANKIVGKFGRGQGVLDFLCKDMGIKVGEKIKGFLLDTENSCYEYDLLGVLKSDMVEKIYIPATDECPDIHDVAALAKETGAILAYAYLGDVGNSVTGDKKAQKFEDDYLDELFECIKEVGFSAVTYMPSRNTKEQLDRIKMLCEKHGFFQISGEDINTPRQKFICEAQRDPAFAHLNEATWALIGHEIAATEDINKAMFSDWAKKTYPDLNDRIKYFASIGRGEI